MWGGGGVDQSIGTYPGEEWTAHGDVHGAPVSGEKVVGGGGGDVMTCRNREETD